ncbi:MAG: hypothetical protein AAF431_11550 [Pseudomonadota bacterium]
MIKHLIKLVVLCSVLLTSIASAQNLNDAYVGMKKKEFKKQFTHLAVAPLVAAPALGLPDEMRKMITDEVLKKLGKAKKKLILPDEVWKFRTQLVSLYPDGVTDENRSAIDDHAYRELLFRHPIDGLVTIQVLAVAAPFNKDKAEWGGTSQNIKHSGDGFIGALTGKGYAGHIAATSIRVLVSDRQGAIVYRWEGGIEVMMQRKGKKLEALPKEQLWQNERRVSKAIRYALKPI